MIIKVKRLNYDANLPTYAHLGDAGADLYSAGDVELLPNQRYAVPTGICIELPTGYEAQVRPRSGLALKKGLTVLNTPGTIDSGYRGEIKVILINLGCESVEIKKGDRIAQLVIAPIQRASFIEDHELSDSERGNGGFGSSGVSINEEDDCYNPYYYM